MPALAAACSQDRAFTPPNTVPPRTYPVDLPTPAPSFQRGINLGNRLDAPNEGDWGPVLEESDFPFIAARGFDHVRLPVRFSAHASAEYPYAVDADFILRVDWAIEQALSAGLSVVLDLHHYEELFTDPAAHQSRLIGIWEQLADHYVGFPSALAFEVVNEPQQNLDAQRYDALLDIVLPRIRALHPDRLIVIDSPDLGYALSLPDLEPRMDPNLVVAVHIYTPTLFTFQGSTVAGSGYDTTGILFPGPPAVPIEPAPEASTEDWARDWIAEYNSLPAEENPSGPAALNPLFEAMDAFMASTSVPIYLGEWGAGDGADPESRAHYTRAIRRAAESRGIGWCIWEDGNAYTLFDSERGEWTTPVVDALFDDVP